MKSLKDIITEGVAVSSDFKLVNTVGANGKPTTRKVRAHRRTMNPTAKDDSEEKPDVLASIQKFVGRQYAEEVEQIDEISKDTLGSYMRKAHAKFDTIRNKKDSESMAKKDSLAKGIKKAYNKMYPPVEPKHVPQIDMSSPQAYYASKSAAGDRYVGDSYELQGDPIIEGQSAAIRMFKALQKAKKQREEEEARKAANEKRALAPKQANEQYVGTGQSKDMQRAVDSAHRDAESKMMKDIHGSNYQDKSVPEHTSSKVDVTSDGKGGYSASVTKTPKPQAAVTTESKHDDEEEDYTKHHKLDPDSGVEADQHIHVQLKKAIDSTMKPYEVTFKNGKKHTVSSPVAKTIVTAIEKLKPEHRKAAHDELHKSYDSLMAVHKAITGK
jgi:hypothetical protein